jgi:hypothetical protein
MNCAAVNVGVSNAALAARDGSDQGLEDTGPLTRRSMIRPHDPLVNGAVIVVVRLRQIARGAHHAEWVEGNGGRGFANGRFD